MKKKIISVVLALSALASTSVFAATLNVTDNGTALTFEQKTDKIAVVSCYDENGILQYSNMYESEDGSFSMNIPEKYKNMKKRIYFVNSKEFKDVEIAATTAPTATPAVTASPEPTVKPTTTPKPTSKPSSSYPAIYEKTIDAIHAPAVVKEVETRSENDEDIYAVTVLYTGEEMTAPVEADFGITTASEEYSFMKGKTAIDLQEGDVICLTANVAGTRVKTLDFIYRPQEEDIVTGTQDFGNNFEKLVSANGKTVANQWNLIKYGERRSSDRYHYAFGLIGKKDSNTLTLINKSGDESKAIEVDMEKDTIVYSCDVENKNEVEISSINEITTTIPKNKFNDTGIVELNDEYSYNYALVRMVEGVATDIVVYNNYNE